MSRYRRGVDNYDFLLFEEPLSLRNDVKNSMNTEWITTNYPSVRISC